MPVVGSSSEPEAISAPVLLTSVAALSVRLLDAVSLPGPVTLAFAPYGNDLERVILSCLAKDPAHRPSSARDLAGSLAACAQATEWSQAQANAWWESQRENLRPAPILSDDTVSIAPTLAVAYERTIDSSQT